MLDLISSGLTSVISMIGDVFKAIFTSAGAWNYVMPLVGLSIGISIVYIGIRIIKSLIKGY